MSVCDPVEGREEFTRKEKVVKLFINFIILYYITLVNYRHRITTYVLEIKTILGNF